MLRRAFPGRAKTREFTDPVGYAAADDLSSPGVGKVPCALGVETMPIQPTVFLVHGRDRRAKAAVTELLEALGLRVNTWPDALDDTPVRERDISRVAEAGLGQAHAIVVLLTADEVAALRPQHWTSGDS